VAGEGGAVEGELLREILHMHAVLLPQASQNEEMVIGDPKPSQSPIVEPGDPACRDIQEKADVLVQLRH
jgi:hypothetical protein